MQKIKIIKAKVPSHTSHFAGWLFSLVGWPSPETTEWFCLRSALWWVIQLAPALHLFAVSPAFAGLARYGTEGQWQLLLLGLLIVQIIAVLTGRVWMRVSALFAFAAIWAFIAAMFWASSPHIGWLARNTGIGVYLALAADCMIVGWHLAYWEVMNWLTRCQRASSNHAALTPLTGEAFLALND